MIPQDILERCVMRAALAPSVHNIQPARWKRDGDVVSLFCDTNICLPTADPSGQASALSCGAVLEAMMLALSAENLCADAVLTGNQTGPDQGLVAVAHLTLRKGALDGLHNQLEQRFTWRGPFDPAPVALFGWTRSDTRFVMDQAGRDTLAVLNDRASLKILQDPNFRNELRSWMRLHDRHPRAGFDGMDRAALQLSKAQAKGAARALGWLWPVLHKTGRTKALMAEAHITSKAPLIALFHRDIHENPVETGRAYLRLCLEAASLGLSGWPMAALSDDTDARREVEQTFGMSSDRKLVQAIRFGQPTGLQPARARRPLIEVLL